MLITLTLIPQANNIEPIMLTVVKHENYKDKIKMDHKTELNLLKI